MIKNQRLQKIEHFIKENKSASLDELVDKFQVSKNTIRRDIQALLEKGGFEKVYGGITVAEHTQVPTTLETFQNRKVKNQSIKNDIAKMAASFVYDDDIIFIDSGTTTIEMIEYLADKHLTIITNNLDFIVHALPYENLDIITIGGILERKTNSFGILKYMDVLNAYNINKAFMAATGISVVNGVTNALPLESELKTAIVKRSSEVFLLVDNDKFDKYGLMTYAQIEDLDYIITNVAPTEPYTQYAEKHHINIIF